MTHSGAPMWVDACPADIDGLHILIADLKRFELDDPEYDLSVLKIATFTRGFPERPLEAIADALGRLNWNDHARRTSID